MKLHCKCLGEYFYKTILNYSNTPLLQRASLEDSSRLKSKQFSKCFRKDKNYFSILYIFEHIQIMLKK